MQERFLGKIEKLQVGRGGYQEMMFGVSVSLALQGGSGVCDFKGTWDQSIEVTEGTRWSETDRSAEFDRTMRWLDDLCRAAKVADVAALVGKPIEATFEDRRLKSWRLLTEVL